MLFASVIIVMINAICGQLCILFGHVAGLCMALLAGCAFVVSQVGSTCCINSGVLN